ncbi:MAG: hypothetical protein IMY85_10780, partial [Chloroflexi bacterium]|nr:hypothetical protein [Chloroflexota bacterium]
QSVITPAAEQGMDEIELQQEGIGPLEITPDSSSANLPIEPAAGQDGGNISSSGKRSASESINGEPGQIDSVAPGGLTLEQEANQPVSWLTYRDQAYSFSIDYPDTYTILPETEPINNADPELIHRIRFLDAQLAAGDTAEYEPPNFTIEIYALGNQSLEEFINNNVSRGEREVYTLGDLTGFRVYFKQLIAPNEFYYFSEHGYVYKLTPLGLYGEEMLLSFEIE